MSDTPASTAPTPTTAGSTVASSARSGDSLVPPGPPRPSSANSNGDRKPTRRKPSKNKSAAKAEAASTSKDAPVGGMSRTASSNSTSATKGPSTETADKPSYKEKQGGGANGKAADAGNSKTQTGATNAGNKNGKGQKAKGGDKAGAKKSPLPPTSASLPDGQALSSTTSQGQAQPRPPNNRTVSNSSKGKGSKGKGQNGGKGGEDAVKGGRTNGKGGPTQPSADASTDQPKRSIPSPIPIPSNDTQRSVSATSTSAITDDPASATSPITGQPPIRSMRASISHSRDALDAAREAAGGKDQANINSALNSLQKMISDLKLMPPVPNTAASASSSGSSVGGSRSASGRREGAKSPLPSAGVQGSQPVNIPTAANSAPNTASTQSILSPGSSSAKLKPDAPAFTPSSATSHTAPSTSPGATLGFAQSQGSYSNRSASHSSEYDRGGRDRHNSVSSISTINPYAGLTNTQPYQSSSFNAGQSYGANIGHTGSFSSQLSPAIGPNPFAGETHDLAALMYNDQYQQLLIAQRVQYQQIQLLQAQIGANQMAAQQAQLQAQQSGSFVAPRFRALAEQRQAQQTQQQIAQLGQAQQVYEMQQQALMKVQEAHARAAAQEALKNPAPVFEEDEEEYNQQQQRKQQALLEQRQKAKEMNPAFNFGAKRQGTDDRQKASSMSPPMGNTVIVDRSQGIGGAQATGLAGLAARAHKRTGSELTPAMQQQLELQAQIEALQAKQKALMEAEKASVSPALSQLSSLVKSPAAPAAATLPAPQAPASSAARTGHRRIQSSFPSAPGPETHGLSSSFNEGSLLEQRMRGEMPPPPVPAAGSHNRRHSVNVFAKNAGAGSGFGGVDQIPEDEAPPQPTHRRTGSRGGSSAFESGNWRSNSISGNNATLASGNVTDLASAQAQLASLAQFRAAAGGGHHRMASFALPNMLPNLLAATTLSAPAGTPDLWRQQQAFQLQLQQSSGTAPSGPQRKSLFAPYLPQASLPPLLQAGKLVVGILRVNKKNRSDAYVATDVLEADIYICGSKDRNRALEGDIVAVELLDVDEVWATKKDKEEKKRKKEENAAYDLKPSTRKQLEKKKDDVEVEGQGLLLVEEEEVSDEVKPMYAGHVVAVVERMPGQLFSGQLGVLRPSSAATKDRQEAERRERGATDSVSIPSGKDAGAALEKPKIVWFKPTDKRVPLIAIPTEQAPEDFVADPEKWADRLFVATIKRWPITSLHPFGNLVEELGPIGDVEVETSALLKDCNFPTEEFAEGAIKCLPPLPWSIPEREYEIRQDLREQRIFTVDPPNAKDLDDALSIKKNEDGSVSVGVHIADVSYFVKANTAMDREARKRATSVYLVQRAVPMLPPQLCEQLCSLVPDVERLAFSAFFDIDSDGRVIQKRFAKTIIRSCAKLSYADAQGVITGQAIDGSKVVGDASAVSEDIKALQAITRKLRTRRVEAGALTSDEKLKVSFTLDESGKPVDVEKYERTDAHSMVEELMLLANTSVALLIASALPEQALLRRHEPPIDRRIEGFVRRAKLMGFAIDATSAGSMQISFEAIKDKESLMCLEMLKKKSMNAAKYFCTGMLDIAKYSHWALNTPLYTHFTSPIRRYADVIVHRMLDSVLTAPNANDVKFLMDRDQVAKISQQCNMKKAGARLAEQQSVHLHLCMLIHDLTEKYGPVIRQGKVTSVLDTAFDIVVPEFAIEKRVHVDKLPLDNTVHDEHRNILSLYWTQKDVLQYIADTTDEPAIKAIVSKPSSTLPESSGQVAKSIQYQKSADPTPPAFDKSSLREPASGHKIQDVKELSDVPVLVCADTSKSPPVLMVYAVNPFAV